MNFSVGIYLSVKFRAFGITFGSVKCIKQVTCNTRGVLSVTDLPDSIPDNSTKLFSKNGVDLRFWTI